ncbi:hypothetical protein QQS21_002731 [Conoideocrella luteorostrata]|uniref:Cupin type-2 domain-containing protein n=1 Tax=Conoideocrella luteorostrata TaxID=1105319 RepID=A0AAJ0CYQ7_9HYPO|nr:hypothetical protein QQS21_002731 [Conoideocrella luteorostrata]
MGSAEPQTAMGEFLKALPAKHLEPLWTRMSAMVPPAPNPVTMSCLWKYREMLPYLATAGAIVPEEMAERRVLMLVNPCMSAPHTTDTIYAGLQLVNPGDTAPAHRHVATACRFIIEGEGFTSVEGTRVRLTRGDVVVTPSWHWHDHGNESSKPVIWLDVLNLPLFTYARVHFAEGYAENRYPSTFKDHCEWRHPWEATQRALDAMPGSHATYHYKASNGDALSATLGARAERINSGTETEVIQDSNSYIYHCYEGRGYSVIESPESGVKDKFLRWESKDTFAVPAYSKFRHVNESSEAAYLVAFHDGPFLDRLELRRP